MTTKQFTIVYPEGTTASTKEAFEVILKEVNEGRMKGLYLPVGFEFKEVQEPVPVLLYNKELEYIVRLLGVMTGVDSGVMVGCEDTGYSLWRKARDCLQAQGIDTEDMSCDTRVTVSIKQD